MAMSTPTGRGSYNRITDCFLDDIVALRARGMGYRAIAESVSHFRGVVVTQHQVNYALARHGEGPRASMVRVEVAA